MGKIVKVKAASLVLNYDLYPRTEVSSVHVSQIADSLTAGNKTDPVVVDEKTKSVVDGFHRIKAHLKAFGPDADIEAELRRYASEAELFADAVRMNAKNSRPLNPYDRTRVIIRAKELGIERERIPEMLGITNERVEEYEIRTATDLSGKTIVPVKAGLRHLRGKRLSKRQKTAMENYGGLHVAFYINQVKNYIEGDLVDRDNETVLTALRELHAIISEFLSVPKKKKAS